MASKKKGLNIRFIAKMTLIVCKLQRLSKMYVQTLLILCCQEFFVVLKYIGFKRKSGVSTGSTFSALTVKREIQKKTAFDPGIPQLFGSTQFQLNFSSLLSKYIYTVPIHSILPLMDTGPLMSDIASTNV